MKLIASLGFLAVAFCQFEHQQAGQTYLIAPRGAPQISFASSWALPETRLARSWTLPRTKVVNSLPRTRLVRSWSLPAAQNVYNQEFTQQRVLKAPVSKTVTVLPNEVTHITRNVQTHMPMVHDRVRHHYNVENINKKNIVHHFIEPVEDKHWGTRQGKSAQLDTNHVVHRRVFNPVLFADQQGGEEVTSGGVSSMMMDSGDMMMSGGNDMMMMNNGNMMMMNGGEHEMVMMDGGEHEMVMMDGGEHEIVNDVDALDTDFTTDTTGTYWKVLEAESCEGLVDGQLVRPEAVCVCSGVMCNNDNCNHLPFPEDIIC